MDTLKAREGKLPNRASKARILPMNSAAPDDINQLLAQWRQKLAAATENLLELNESPVRKRLAKPEVAARLEGATRAPVEAALEAIGELFQGFSLLSEVIERARDLQRAPVWPWQADGRAREVNHLLREDSIELGWEATPLARRGLLSATGRARRVSPEELLRAMTREFEDARDTLLRVARAWDELPLELAALENELAPWSGSGASISLNEALCAELQAICASIQSMRASLSTDPLGAHEQWPLLRARGDALLQKIEQSARQTRELTGELARAEAVLSEVIALHARAEDALAETRLAVHSSDSPARTPLAASDLDDLAAWLDTLRATFAAGRFEAARVGVVRWHEQTARALEHDRLALESNRALLQRRDELRGLLDALSAKARALAARGVTLDTSLQNAAGEAKNLLGARPVPLERVAFLVAQFESGLARAK